uniref:Ig-like domain-containing protein n=1 Tax=Callorhinchus milii TaxID=7868 RepID=A0A4W3H4V9_CALMI
MAVQISPQVVTGNENGNVSMECNTTGYSPTFQWYKQYGNGSIRFLVLGKSEVNVKDRIRASTNTKEKNCTLTIKNVRLTDTATYFCA